MVLHDCHHINIPSHVVYPFGDNVFCCKHLKDGFLSSGVESKTTEGSGARDGISLSYPARFSNKQIINKQEDAGLSNWMSL